LHIYPLIHVSSVNLGNCREAKVLFVREVYFAPKEAANKQRELHGDISREDLGKRMMYRG
jgi:hypothetical protein